MIYSADYIIAISENTKRDILYYYPDISEKNISIIYHGAVPLENRYWQAIMICMLFV